MVELIITEKPSSAQKVAEALSEGKITKKKNKQSFYYELTYKNKKIFVTSAVGHLYGLEEKKKAGWTYPVFEVMWKPSYEGDKELAYVKDYLDTISSLAKKADEITIACDYDIEGEVIGLNVVRFACKRKDAHRMKFSTLTKEDLVYAYEHKMHHLDWGQAHAGETRHTLDWFYGINLSRALTASVKAAGSFKIMSIGRVQGPALKIVVDREKEITVFKPVQFWELHLQGTHTKTHSPLEAQHEKGQFFDEKEVKSIFKKISGEKDAKVERISRTQRQQTPPFPFDLTSLQSEVYAQFRITPKETLDHAQSLYLAGVTSYPRTSSQQLDPKLGFRNILHQLSKQQHYQELVQELLKLPRLEPHNGKKTDPAHPAIYPTGVAPKALKERQQKIYDLIVKRFLATFAEPALRETMEVSLDVKSEHFIAKGTRTLQENWHRFYKPYLKIEEITLPDLKEHEIIAVKKMDLMDKETQPPNRYNQASLIKELERRNLGTKATRADILERLFQRGYAEGVQIKATKLGIETLKVLEKHAPVIVDEQLTVHFEEDMEKIREGQEKPQKVLDEAKEILTKMLADFKKKEVAVGKEIIESIHKTQEEQNYMGECKSCGKGKLTVKRGKFGRFIACDKYPACKTTFKVPQAGMLLRAEKECEHCSYPRVKLVLKGKRPLEACINPNCKSKVDKKREVPKLDRKCPDCGMDLVLRRSFYGEFIGCSGYPKCKHVERIAKVAEGESGKGGSATKKMNSGKRGRWVKGKKK